MFYDVPEKKDKEMEKLQKRLYELEAETKEVEAKIIRLQIKQQWSM